MRWRVLIVRPWTEKIDDLLEDLSRAGIEADVERVDTKPALLAAIERQEWDLVLYDPAARDEVPIEIVYTHSPASAVVVAGEREETRDELTRLVRSHAFTD